MSNNSQNIDSIKIRLVAPAAVAAACGLLSPVAWSAPGDLDPSFGDVGRAIYGVGDAWGAVWALALEGDDVLFSGGEEETGWYDSLGIIGRLDASGQPDVAFLPYSLYGAEFRDIRRQADGKVIAVGKSRDSGYRNLLTVMRLNSDGVPDTGFGTGGQIQLAGPDEAPEALATSMVLEPDGGITVAGRRSDGRVVIVRLTPEGARDLTFGSGGWYVGPAGDARDLPHIVRVGSAGYRVLVTSGEGTCALLGISVDGQALETIGPGGVVRNIFGQSRPQRCNALAVAENSQLLAGGSMGDIPRRGYVGRFDLAGRIDKTFDTGGVAAALESVAAVAVIGTSIYVAGDEAGEWSSNVVLSLSQSGLLDLSYGEEGLARIEIGHQDRVHALQPLADGAVLVAGWSDWRPYIARLLGSGSGASPGVIGVEHRDLATPESAGEVTVIVRRSGGRSGAVSVGYATRAADASAGADFTEVSGRIAWADGESGAREVVVPVATDGTTDEREEVFALELADPTGGAGLAARATSVAIYGDSYPGGSFAVSAGSAREGTAVDIVVQRSEYSASSVSMLLSLSPGSAVEGADYRAIQPVTLTWESGDFASKSVRLQTVEDDVYESNETVTVTLSNISDSARIASGQASIVIVDDDMPDERRSGGDGGGGSAGWLLAGLFALLGAFRRSGVR